MDIIKSLSLALAVMAALIGPQRARAQSTAFTYQGRLNNAGVAANGSFDLSFGLFTNSVGGNAVSPSVTNLNTGVSNGLFTVTLDFGNAFSLGAPRYLEIAVRTNGGSAFTLLSPRQSIAPTPYAITASGAPPIGLAGGALTGSYPNPGVSATGLVGIVPTNNLPANLAALAANNGGALNNLTSVSTNQNLTFVSPFGSDTTGKTNRFDLPFKTLTAAKTATSAGGTIWVWPGTYNETDLLKNKVNWHFCNGANLFYTGSRTNAIFDDASNAITSTITGEGKFTWFSSDTNFPTTGLLMTQNPNTTLYIQAALMSAGQPAGVEILSGNIAVAWIIDCNQVIVDCPIIRNEGDDGSQEVAGIYWMQGNCAFHTHYLTTSSGGAIAASENTPAGIGAGPTYPNRLTETSMYVFADEILSTNGSAMNLYSDTILQRVWVQSGRIATTGAGSQLINILGAGKEYVTAQKLDGGANGAPLITMTPTAGGTSIPAINGSASLWVVADKLSSSNQWLEATGGTTKMTVQQYEDYGTIGTGISVVQTGNNKVNVELFGGHMIVTNGVGLSVTGGNVNLNGVTIDTSAGSTTNKWPVNVVSNGLSLQNIKLVGPANAYAINAAAAANVQSLGVFSTFGNNPNVTLTPNGGFYSNASLK